MKRESLLRLKWVFEATQEPRGLLMGLSLACAVDQLDQPVRFFR